jgi:uncharacterized protein
VGKYNITTDVFTLDYKDNLSILYAPLVGFACVLNRDSMDLLAELEDHDGHSFTSKQEDFINVLIKRRVINSEEPCAPQKREAGELVPSKLTLFPTNQCNLKCIYCYADAGDLRPKTMDFSIAVSAIEYFISVLKKERKTVFPMELHGGGEPLYAWSLVQRIVDYAEKRCEEAGLELNVYAGTNGILNEKQLNWILKHMRSMNISFDGLPHVQDFHRPMNHTGSSFKVIDETLKFLDQSHFPYAVRCTVTNYNENLLDETIDFITRNYQTRLIHLEPVQSCRRNIEAEEDLIPDLNKFMDNYLRLEPICTERGVRLAYSGVQLERPKKHFCYVGTDNFAVTPDGYLTNCWEVTHHEHPMANTFLFGRMLPNGQIEIDQKKLDYLRTLSVDHFQYCANCFAKWHCAGNCVTKLGHHHFLGKRDSVYCDINRRLIKTQLIRLLEREDYFQSRYL